MIDDVDDSSKCKELLERIAKLFELELFPEKSVLRSVGPMWMLVDPKDQRGFLCFEAWGGWEFASLRTMLEEFMESECFFMCTDCGRIPGSLDIPNPLLGCGSLEELEMKLDISGF